MEPEQSSFRDKWMIPLTIVIIGGLIAGIILLVIEHDWFMADGKPLPTPPDTTFQPSPIPEPDPTPSPIPEPDPTPSPIPEPPSMATLNKYLNELADPRMTRSQVMTYKRETLEMFSSPLTDVKVVSNRGNYLETLTIQDYVAKQRLLKRDQVTVKDLHVDQSGKIRELVVTETRKD